jgi:hypothetical protein
MVPFARTLDHRGPQKEEGDVKRLLILCATAFVWTSSLPSVAGAQSIECASDVPAARTGHWYYRIIDGRKCWYQGKPMLPKSSLHWPKSSVDEADAATRAIDDGPTTDGRNVSASPAPDPNVWPAPVLDDTSFESRWQALKAGR